jgi:hypothetical protein
MSSLKDKFIKIAELSIVLGLGLLVLAVGALLVHYIAFKILWGI